MGLSGLPALPTSSNSTGSNVTTRSSLFGGASSANGANGSPQPAAYQPSAASGSAFGGGLSGLMQAVQTIEQGYQLLAQMAPSLAPVAAQGISSLRAAIPSALGAMATPNQSGIAPPPDAGPPRDGMGAMPPK